MGGGVGLSVHGSHRVAGDRYPVRHAGGRHRLLSRCRRDLVPAAAAGRARHLLRADRRAARRGRRRRRRRIATHRVPSARFPDLLDALCGAVPVDALLAAFAEPAARRRSRRQRAAIDRLFAGDRSRTSSPRSIAEAAGGSADAEFAGRDRRDDPHQIADQPEARAGADARRHRPVIRRVHADRIPHSVAHHPWPRLLRRGARGDRRQGQRAALAAGDAGRGHARPRSSGISRRLGPTNWCCRSCTRDRATPSTPIRPRTLEPVHADEQRRTDETRWTARLVMFLRVMAGALDGSRGCITGRWCAASRGPDGRLRVRSRLPWQTATVFFAVIDLVAAVGLWLAAAWGAVVWLTAAVSMAAVEVFFPQVYGGRMIVVVDRGRAAVRLSVPRHPIGARASALNSCARRGAICLDATVGAVRNPAQDA